MHDFGKLVYMDPQKTGSTFVSQFLRETCILRELREWKHGRLNSRPKKRAYYFVTVRHPVSQYSSLFRYGLDKRGGLYERLSQLGQSDLYTSEVGAFNKWLRFVMDYRNSAYLGEGFERVPESFNLGFMSYRYLMMSLARPEETLLQKPATIDLLDYAREKSIVHRVLFTERLNDDLMELATKLKPQYFDQDKVRSFFEVEERANASKTGAEVLGGLDEELVALVANKERVLLSLYSDQKSEVCSSQQSPESL